MVKAPARDLSQTAQQTLLSIVGKVVVGQSQDVEPGRLQEVQEPCLCAQIWANLLYRLTVRRADCTLQVDNRKVIALDDGSNRIKKTVISEHPTVWTIITC